MNTITLRLRGCNFGKARPFVEKLRDAFTPTGGTVNMTAPLHFDEFHDITGGTVEYLAHKFTLKVKEQFLKPDGSADRDALLAAFDTAALTYLDGTEIPATLRGEANFCGPQCSSGAGTVETVVRHASGFESSSRNADNSNDPSRVPVQKDSVYMGLGRSGSRQRS